MKSGNYGIKGMHCASCASIIEKTLKKVEGVNSAVVNYGTEAVKLSYDESKTNLEHLSTKIEPLGYSILTPKQKKWGCLRASIQLTLVSISPNKKSSKKLRT